MFICQYWCFTSTDLSFIVIETEHLKHKNFTINYLNLLLTEVIFLTWMSMAFVGQFSHFVDNEYLLPSDISFMVFLNNL